MSTRPDLKLVEAQPPAPAASPEGRLRTLFRKEARVERQLIAVRQCIQAERKRYAEKHRLGCFPAVDHLRRIFR